jgi:hypothetical protein
VDASSQSPRIHERQTGPSAFTTADLRGKLTGALSTPPGSRVNMTFLFNFPLYELGPSTTTVWTQGTTGTWDIDDSHPLLTPAPRAQGWHMMLITAPGDATKAPSRVMFTFDADGHITAIEFASFLGIESALDKHMALHRKNLPLNCSAPGPYILDVDPAPAVNPAKAYGG